MANATRVELDPVKPSTCQQDLVRSERCARSRGISCAGWRIPLPGHLGPSDDDNEGESSLSP